MVPITNARFALNAVNAVGAAFMIAFMARTRWAHCHPQVDMIAAMVPALLRARVFLDETFPIQGASHADVRRYYVHEGQLLVDDMPLAQPEKFVGYTGNAKAPIQFC